MAQKLLQPTVFELKGVNADYCNSKTNTGKTKAINIKEEITKLPFLGEFSCLMVRFWLKRNFLPYLVEIYMPCCLLIFISWLPFWLKKDAVLERIFISKKKTTLTECSH